MLLLMPILLIISAFIAGALICNSIPHLSTGLRGEAFPTPFAGLRGAPSSPVANVLWGWINLFLGLAVLPRLVVVSPVMPLFNTIWLGFALGFLLAGLYLAWYFGRARQVAK